MAPFRIQRLPRYAETLVANLCAKYGAVSHEPQEDENGWDYLVEFPAEDLPGPKDMHPASDHCYVQVKTRRDGQLQCRVSLSNALKSAQSDLPWFIVLIVSLPDNRTSIYGKHVWEDLIAASLKRVRLAELAGRRLNKSEITISFTEEDRFDDGVIEWMHQTIRTQQGKYREKKGLLFKSVGFEKSAGSGRFTFSADSESEFYDALLGRGNSVVLDQFTFSPERFGLSSDRPTIDLQGAVLTVQAVPSGQCEIRVRSPRANTYLSFRSDVYAYRPPGEPSDRGRLRIANQAFEIEYVMPERAKFIFCFDGRVRHPLDFLHQSAVLRSWLSEGYIDVQAWTLDGNRMFHGRIEVADKPTSEPWDQVAPSILTLQSLCASTSCRASLAEIWQAIPLIDFFNKMTESRFFKAEMPNDSILANKIDGAIYRLMVTIADVDLFAIVVRDVKQDTLDDSNTRHIVFGPPSIKEQYAILQASEKQRARMDQDYEFHLQDCDRIGQFLDFGDIRDFLSRAGK